MSAVGYVDRLRAEQPARRGLPDASRNFLFVAVSTAAALTAILSSSVAPGATRWTDFAVLAAGGALFQLFAAPVGANQSFHTGLAFAVAAALLLPPELVVLVCVVQHVPDWRRHRYRAYVQVFNIANYALSGLAAWAVRVGLGDAGIDVTSRTSAATVLVAGAAGAVFVFVNHSLLAVMLKLARGRDLRSSGLFGLESLVTDLVLASSGLLLAFLLLREPALTPVAALPLILIHRALVIPSLREQAFRDHKTGLLNSRGFDRAAADEFARAQRFGRPLSVLICDIDDLRGINSGHGHLGGDVALGSVADALRAELRHYDLCARFGGDEFVVVLPETGHEDATAVAERIQTWLATHPAETREGRLVVGVSIGSASYGEGDLRIGDLIGRADAAMYRSKRAGTELLPVAG